MAEAHYWVKYLDRATNLPQRDGPYPTWSQARDRAVALRHKGHLQVRVFHGYLPVETMMGQ